MTDSTNDAPLKKTPLDSLHRSLGARMVPFAGYDMPVQYKAGIIAEHQHTRTHCGIFDVSHMGQAHLIGDGAVDVLESLTPGSLKELKPGRQRYTLLLNETGGVVDDLMVSCIAPGKYFLVVNASRKDVDFPLIESALKGRAELHVIDDRALVAVQGPTAGEVMAHFAPATASMVFMDAGPVDVGGIPCFVTRSGYTGEDGFEVSVPADQAEKLVRHFLEMEGAEPVGLGARDSLRLEAGLPLYGNDVDVTTTPAEAALTFAIGKRRRQEGGFPGADKILAQLKNGVERVRVGLRPEGRAPARAHTEIQDVDGKTIGEVTSGGYGPTVEAPIAMGYVSTANAEIGTRVKLIVRGKALDAEVAAMPFVAQRYHRG